MRTNYSLPFALLVGASLLASGGAAAAQFVVADDIGTFGLGDHMGGGDGVITPDGRYGIVQETSSGSRMRFYDMASGALIQTVTPGGQAGVIQDGVVCTNTRAAALAGNSVVFFDLTLLPANPMIAFVSMAHWPRDLEITPDGTLLAVRGGLTPQNTGRVAIFDLATGVELASSPGAPPEYPSARHSFDVDSVAVSDSHAIFTSVLYPAQGDPTTRVTIFDLHPAGGGAPVVVFETESGNGTDQEGAPHDIAITPDGRHCAVRSELEVAVYRLNGSLSTQRWKSGLAGNPGPFGNSALDSIEVTNSRVATISRQSNGAFPIGVQVDVFEMSGGHGFDRQLGDPHDLVIDADGDNLFVRTHLNVLHYGIGAWTAGGAALTPVSSMNTIIGTNTSWGAGLDSIDVNGTRVVSLQREFDQTYIYIHDIASGVLELVGDHIMDDMPVDLAITPSGNRCVVTGLATVEVLDMNTAAAILHHDIAGNGSWPWADGVVLNQEQALTWGVIGPNLSGWTSIIDLFDQPVNYCTGAANSAGSGAAIYANGSASIASNDLELRSQGLPTNQFGQFFYGPTGQSLPLGNGFLCVGGSLRRLSVGTTSATGLFGYDLDYGNLPPGGAIQAGETWRFQFLYRDPAAGGAQFNLSDGLEVTFGA